MPRRTEPFGVAVYAPLAEAPVDPDVVLVRGDARQIMLVAEAARAAGIGHDGAAMGRPACAMIPAGHEHGPRQHEPRLHRQPRLHGPRRRRAVLHHSRPPLARRGRQARDRRPRQPRAGALPRGPSRHPRLNPLNRPTTHGRASRRSPRRRSHPERRRARSARRSSATWAREVVKVERPGRGDDARAWAPPFWGQESATFMSVNRNKRSLAVDLKARRRAARSSSGWSRRADVLRAVAARGRRRRAGARLGAARAGSTRASSTARSPPSAPRARCRTGPGYDPLMQAYGGIMSVNGHPGQAPARVPHLDRRHGHRHVGGDRHPGRAARARPHRAAAWRSPPRCSTPRSRGSPIQMSQLPRHRRGAAAAGLGHRDDRAVRGLPRRATAT